MDKLQIDPQKEHEMFGEIRAMEGQNLKTKKYDEKTMVTKIMKIIIKDSGVGK